MHTHSHTLSLSHILSVALFLCVCRYESEEGEAGLRRLNEQISSIKRESEGKARERKSLEEKREQLQKLIANVEVTT